LPTAQLRDGNIRSLLCEAHWGGRRTDSR